MSKEIKELIIGMGRRLIQLEKEVQQLKKYNGGTIYSAGDENVGGLMKIAGYQEIAGEEVLAGKKKKQVAGNWLDDALNGVNQVTSTIGQSAMNLAPVVQLGMQAKMLGMGKKKRAPQKKKSVDPMQKYIF
jgi:hypothetical protein